MHSPIKPPTYSTIALEQVLYAVRRILAPLPFLSEAARISYLAEEMALELRAEVLAEKLPPARVEHTVRDKKMVTVTGECPRFATWRDHFKATYRGRWWMRWRHWSIRYGTGPVTHEHEVTCRHSVILNLEKYRTYPQARFVLSPEQFGRPVHVSIRDDIRHLSDYQLR